MDEQAILIQGLAKMGLAIPPEPFMEFIHLLHKWNQTYNLTAIQTPQEMINRHLLDSLAVAPFVKGQRIADVGTGAGLPGIPLAIYFKDKQFVLIESVGKKVRFLETVVRSLSLPNVEIIGSRVEDYRGAIQFDTVVSRALSSLNQFVTLTRHLLTPGGHWIAMKGKLPHDELLNVALPYTLHPYQVPGLIGERCVVCIENK